MDKLTSLNLSFDRILIMYVIPGFVAACPWVIFVLHFHQETKTFLLANNSISITVMACISLVFGLVIENFGSLIEVYCYDKINMRKNANFQECWKKYLQLSYKDEPIGQRYIRNILLRMKFELGMGVACVSFDLGLRMEETIKANLFHDDLSRWTSYGIPVILCLYFIVWEARKSSAVLAKRRQDLVDKYSVC